MELISENLYLVFYSATASGDSTYCYVLLITINSVCRYNMRESLEGSEWRGEMRRRELRKMLIFSSIFLLL